eukprot:TRINITY_DN27241_c0_g1_i1.p1 TRINITY_DN27241_c0_g1~~TRINITY_DN27241_c0_g1_i1.p1  ORF type:complete len:978 (+),score=202.39 TRINITY_DN27241_c0_g1_i1:106-3039(+)
MQQAWSDNMRRVAGPHLTAMTEEIRQSYGPDVDPEAMLLQWLCSRRQLEPPTISVIRKPKTPPKLPAIAGPASPTKASAGATQAALPAAPQTARGPSTALSASAAEALKPKTPQPETSSPLTARLKTSTPLAPPPLPGYANRDGHKEMTREQVTLAVFEGKITPWSKTLTKVVDQIAHDELRHTQRSEHLKGNNSRIAEMMACMQQELRGQFLCKVPLLSAKVLDEFTQFKLFGCLHAHNFNPGEDIITEDDVGDKLYVIDRGVCDVLKKMNGREMTVAQLGKGAFFGEIALLYDMPRTATVRAATQVTALSLSRADVRKQLSEEDLARMKLIARTQVFSSMPLLAGLGPEQKAKVAEKLKRQKWVKGAIVAGQNHITERVYIVEQGTLLMEVTDRSMLPSFMQAFVGAIRLGPGQYFGMRGLLYDAPYGFNVTASSEEVFTLSISYKELLETAGDDLADQLHLASIMQESMQSYLLRQIPQLKMLADPSFNQVRQQAQIVHFKRWAVIFNKGDPLQNVYVLEMGKLMEFDGDCNDMQVMSDKEVKCPERTTPGEFFGTECLTQKSAKAPYSLVAITDVQMLRLPPDAVWAVQQEQRQFIDKIPLFSQDIITKDEQYMLVSKLKPWTFRAGQYIMKEGEIGDMLYIIERGICDACKTIEDKEIVLVQLKKGFFFGELAVIFDMPRTASVRATTDIVALSLSREDLMSAIGEEKISKMRMVARTQVFSGIPMLANRTPAAKNTIARRMKPQTWKPGEPIVQETSVSKTLYIIEKGQVTVSSADMSNPIKMVAGMAFGAAGLLHGEPYGLTIAAGSEEVKTLSLSMEDIFSTAGMGEQDALERNLRSDYRAWLLKQLPPMKGKNDEFYKATLNHCETMEVKKGDTILKVGQQLESVYIVEKGSFEMKDVMEGMSTKQWIQPSCGFVGSVVAPALTFYGAELLDAKGASDKVLCPYTLEALADGFLLRVPSALIKMAMRK